uniref:Uncharacterized protein n=1 Tax=Picea sitchensis TaxID=3332 RepID=A0A6B9XQR2_PICSI|nr:hypothetical protein Q903MT_gene5474 [Picea sitchensis]
MSNDAMLLVAFCLVNWKVNFDIRSLVYSYWSNESMLIPWSLLYALVGMRPFRINRSESGINIHR